jgi:HlyD family type I secretion membrane fusion protein
MIRNSGCGIFVGGAMAVLLAGVAPQALAQWKPDRIPELIVSVAPGGNQDITARTIQSIWQDKKIVSPVNVINAEQSINQRHAELARAQQRVAELEQRLPVLMEDFRNNAALEYRQARERLLDAEERLRPAVEALNNLMVRSPTGGTVVNLTRLGIGAVLGAKETVAELVPLERGLILEGSLPTEQVAFLSPGMPARVRIQQLSKIGYDELMGVIETISADTISQGMLGTAVYIVQVDLGQLPPDIEAVMRPGMPVEIYIQTGTRTPFQYLSEPITSFLNRAARE